MDIVYGLIPIVLLFGFLVVVVFIWMAKSGHFDDLDGAANRIFMDDEFPDEAEKIKQSATDDINSRSEVADSEKKVSSKLK